MRISKKKHSFVLHFIYLLEIIGIFISYMLLLRQLGIVQDMVIASGEFEEYMKKLHIIIQAALSLQVKMVERGDVWCFQ